MLSDCFLALGEKIKGGYIRYRIGGGKRVLAHRQAYMNVFGHIPKNMCVLHKCDTPACINPTHLFLGTHLDNMRDKVNKNRQFIASGEKSGRAKLTEVQVTQIKLDSRTQLEIAKDFEISQQHVSAIKRGRFWKCLN